MHRSLPEFDSLTDIGGKCNIVPNLSPIQGLGNSLLFRGWASHKPA
jgi:hypothetical protein